ncbi:uncharacterized protein G2W53_039324 [Senna tora]|uniref:ATP-dependent DNA helicase n=1 Tax=Senna tora TaxID=362788 RepID=A0A834SQH5_9FABA|nr:uncharacterized protein G2W53_039324 [Senna tora]
MLPCEAAWRIFAFDIHFREPAVERLSFHLPNEQIVIFKDDDSIESVVDRPNVHKTKFLAWMDANKKYPEVRELTYVQFPTKFVWKKETHQWSFRKRGFAIGRLHFVPHGSGELYYLRLLLNSTKGPTSYVDIRTINNIVYTTFKEAFYAMSFLDDDKEYIDGIKEASQWGTAAYLRKLFATLLFSNQLGRPEVVWDNTWRFLSDDILHRQRLLLRCEDMQLSEEEFKNHTLAEIENLLRSNNRSLSEFSSMPYPDMSLLTHSQVYVKIMSSIENLHGKIFFLCGYGGTGKTFLWRTLSTALRSKGEIALIVASSGIASLLLPGGRTAHSRFAIPININEDSTCNIKRGTRQDIVYATINSSYLWQYCEVLTLRTNMRIESENSECEVEKAREFSEWILRVGDGRIGEPNDEEVCIDISDEFLINGSNDPIGSLVDSTYPSFLENMSIDGYLQHRAILAPTNEIVERINDYMLALVPGEMKTFLSFDSPCTMGGDVDRIDDIHTSEFLNTITSSGLPKHELKLKVGVPVMLLRNIDQSTGLCNGSQLLITQLGNHVLEGKIISGTNSG